MLEWVFHAAEQVAASAESDPEFQDLARQQAELAPQYESLLERLSPRDRELILEYTDVLGNLQYRMTQLAYQFGKRSGRMGTRR